MTIREEYVRCGRKNCKKCPHGPYRYRYWREGGKLRKKYLGKGTSINMETKEKTVDLGDSDDYSSQHSIEKQKTFHGKKYRLVSVSPIMTQAFKNQRYYEKQGFDTELVEGGVMGPGFYLYTRKSIPNQLKEIIPPGETMTLDDVKMRLSDETWSDVEKSIRDLIDDEVFDVSEGNSRIKLSGTHVARLIRRE